jgi:filamentous hemagglutinin family protein
MNDRKDRIPQMPYISFLKSTERGIEESTFSLTDMGFDPAKESYIICRNCGNIITSLESMISVNGQHQHTFINPSGIVFTIGCFSKAEGCITAGEPMSDFTWFNSYSWNHALCANCLFHLGWFYNSGSDSFFGLILDNLRETDRTH